MEHVKEPIIFIHDLVLKKVPVISVNPEYTLLSGENNFMVS